MFWMFVAVLWVAMLVSPFVLLYLFLPKGRACPQCASETVPIRSRWPWPARSFAGLRWCLACGWEGVVRHARVSGAVPHYEAVPEEPEEADDDAPWRSR